MMLHRSLLLAALCASTLSTTACNGPASSAPETTAATPAATPVSPTPTPTPADSATPAAVTAEPAGAETVLAAPVSAVAPAAPVVTAAATRRPVPAAKPTATPPVAAAAVVAATPAAPAAFSHDAFDKLLKKYVNSQGRVNYKGFKSEEKAFDAYLAQLSQNPPKAADPRAEQMAYWINAYNAYTIRLILDNYPLKSIKDIGEPWKKMFFSIGGTKMSLDNIEHDILRKKFDDPRIHFALVCASISCPPLRPEAYSAARLSQQLDAQGRAFLNDAGKNTLNPQSAQLSNYFNWYKEDWNKDGQSVVKWVNKYAKTTISDDTKIGYTDYNWNLNQQ